MGLLPKKKVLQGPGRWGASGGETMTTCWQRPQGEGRGPKSSKAPQATLGRPRPHRGDKQRSESPRLAPLCVPLLLPLLA